MSKPKGRLGKSYRIMWDQNHGQESFYNPPVSCEKIAQGHFGFFEGTPVDAYVCALGPDCGYAVSYPTKVRNMEFLVDRFNDPNVLAGGVEMWRHGENLRRLWEAGIDSLKVQVDEARRLGIDFWFRISMNDWHHRNSEGENWRLMGSRFFAEHPEYWIGEDGADPSWPEATRQAVRLFQNYAFEEVRRLRLDIAAEACQRYDVDGFEYDFMRCPGYFKYNEVEKNLGVMTQFIRDTRAALDEIGKKKNKPIGLSVRVPNTVTGARNLGLDVATWIEEDLVDIVVPSTFFSADMQEDMSEWVELAHNTPVRINPAIEEGYNAGYTGGVVRCFYSPPVMLPLTHEMINAIAAKHWSKGVDGLYVFNWFGTAPCYNHDNRPALDDMGNPLRLKYKNKRYVVMRTDHSFPNCLPDPHQIPITLDAKPKTITLDVADDLAEAGDRVKNICLQVYLTNMTVEDTMELKLNGQVLKCMNPLQPGAYSPLSRHWQDYEVPSGSVRCGNNEISVRMVERNKRLAKELSVELTDLELTIEYNYPNGRWEGLRC